MKNYSIERRNIYFYIDVIEETYCLEAKQKGYGDRQIAHMLGCLESEVYNKRKNYYQSSL